MQNILVVCCNSCDNTIEMWSDKVLLTKLTWDIHDETCGFLMENADFLVDVYAADFFVLSEVAIVQFIMSVADKIKKDQQLQRVVYLSSDGAEKPCPMFFPFTLDDDSLPVLPSQQLSLCEIWKLFQQKFGGFISWEFIHEIVPEQLREGFMDLINVELSLLRKEEA